MGSTISLMVVLTRTFCVILASTTSSGLLMVFAQINQTKAPSSSPSTNQTKSSSPSQSSAASTPQITKVKITSPTKDQQVPVGKDLTISGISIDNATANTNDCKVSVIVNKVRPYQPANPATSTTTTTRTSGGAG